MNKKGQEKKLNFFQILKQGTSFRNNIVENKQNSIDIEDEKQQIVSDSQSETEEEIKLQKKILKKGTPQQKEELLQQMKKKQNKQKQKMINLMKNNKIHIEGQQYDLMNKFSKLYQKYQFPENFVKNLEEAGFTQPTPVQMATIPIQMEKKNLVAIAPTGSGKTLSFAIPLLHHLNKNTSKQGLRSIALAPSFELSNQIYKELIFLNAKSNSNLKIRILSNLNSNHETLHEQQKHIDILVATPLNLLKLLKLEVIEYNFLEYIVMDESDKYFELGFKTQINQILDQVSQNQKIVYSLFSATISFGVEELIKNFLKDSVKVFIGGKNNVLNSIEQKLVYVGDERGKMFKLKEMINSGQFVPPVLIFVQSKERSQELLEEFKKDTTITIDNIHSDKSHIERENIVNKFRIGDLFALICTDLMARGIDFKGVNLVINYDFPNQMINYIHRVGRTGRANRQGKSVTFYTDVDKPLIKTLGKFLLQLKIQ